MYKPALVPTTHYLKSTPFLQEIVNRINVDKSNLSELKDYCFVFPTRRAGMFFCQYLSKRFKNQYIWSPKIFAISDFIAEFSPRAMLDDTTIAFELYKIYSKYEPLVNTKEGFDKFYAWGQLLIKDFNEIDTCLVNADKLFSNLKDIKEIEELFSEQDEVLLEVVKQFFRVIKKEHNTELEDNFIKIWEIMGKLYFELQENFKRSPELANAQNSRVHAQTGYEGMMEQELATLIANNKIEIPYKHLVFAGFNAISAAQEKIFFYLVEHHNAEMVWDADIYYLNNNIQESGTFIRKYYHLYQNHPRHHWLISDFANIKNSENTKKTIQINIVGVPLKVGQAKFVGQNLLNLMQSNTFEQEKTAIILGDEALLMPMLHALPSNKSHSNNSLKVNVTMGYALKNTLLYQLLDTIIQLHLNASENNEKPLFNTKFVLQILNNPFIKQLEPSEIEKYTQYVHKNNLTKVYGDVIQKRLPFKIIQQIFSKNANFLDLIESFKQILWILHTQLKNKSENIENEDIKLEETEEPSETYSDDSALNLELEFIYQLLKHVNQLHDILQHYRQQIQLSTFAQLFKEVIYSAKMPFSGEPLQGLQIMGFLETRTLDFENIYLLSCNEDIIPNAKPHHTFIPFHLRKGFKMRTFLDQEDIYGYHFYRLLQRSKNVYLIYDTEMGELSSGEKSRFLWQLERELPLISNKVTINTQLISTPVVQYPKIKHLKVPKNDFIMQKLQKYVFNTPTSNSKYLSATALNAYMECPIKFYAQYIAELYEQDEITDKVTHAMIGNLLHKTLELIYTPFISKLINHKQIEELINSKNIAKHFNQAFKYLIANAKTEVENENYESKDFIDLSNNFFEEGENYLIKQAIIKLVEQILQNDLKSAPFTIVSLESSAYKLLMEIDGNLKIGVKGIIDRIDKVIINNKEVYRIIDYKTGKVKIKDSESVLSESMDAYLSKYFDNTAYKAGFQAYLYAFLFKKKYPNREVQVGLYAVKEMNKKGISFLRKGEIISNELLLTFENKLTSLLSEIFDPNTPFTQTDKEQNYTYSPYINFVEF